MPFIALIAAAIGTIAARQAANDAPDPRRTGSPNIERATAWAVDRLKEMRLSNVRTESWGEFGFGWIP